MDKLKEFARLFFIILGFTCFMVILGTAGESDLGKIDISQILVRCVPALMLLIISFIASKKLGDADDF